MISQGKRRRRFSSPHHFFTQNDLSDRVVQQHVGPGDGTIADALHVTPVTVRTRLLRARWILRRELVAYVSHSGSRGGPESAGGDTPTAQSSSLRVRSYR